MLTETQKNKKGPLSHRKKMFVFQLSQLLMISQAIQKNVDQNTKKRKRLPESSKNKMFVFQLRSTSDDLAKQSKQIMLTKTQKNEKGPLSH